MVLYPIFRFDTFAFRVTLDRVNEFYIKPEIGFVTSPVMHFEFIRSCGMPTPFATQWMNKFLRTQGQFRYDTCSSFEKIIQAIERGFSGKSSFNFFPLSISTGIFINSFSIFFTKIVRTNFCMSMIAFSISFRSLSRFFSGYFRSSHSFLILSGFARFAIASISRFCTLISAKIRDRLGIPRKSAISTITDFCFHDYDYTTRKECAL